MTSLENINLPEELYQQIVKIAHDENNSIESQIVILLQKALRMETQEIESGRRNKILKLLEETQNVRRSKPKEIIKEDRDR